MRIVVDVHCQRQRLKGTCSPAIAVTEYWVTSGTTGKAVRISGPDVKSQHVRFYKPNKRIIELIPYTTQHSRARRPGVELHIHEELWVLVPWLSDVTIRGIHAPSSLRGRLYLTQVETVEARGLAWLDRSKRTPEVQIFQRVGSEAIDFLFIGLNIIYREHSHRV